MKFRVLQLWWRGHIVIRGLPEVFYFLVFHNKEVHKVFELDHNPIERFDQMAVTVRTKDKLLTKDRGQIPADNPLNPHEEIPIIFRTLDKGPVEIHEDELTVKGLFKGKKLKGAFLLKRDSPRVDMWTWMKTETTESEYAPVAPSGKILGKPLKPKVILDAFKKPIVVDRNYVFLTNPDRITRGDFDLIIRAVPNAWYDRPVHFRLFRAILDKHPDLAFRVHLLTDPRGPFTDFIPVYDLVLVPAQPEIIRMSETWYEATLQYHEPVDELDFTPHFDLRIDVPQRPGLIKIVLINNPQDYKTVYGYVEHCPDKAWLKKEGLVQLNDILSKVTIIDRGKVQILEETREHLLLKINMEKLKGTFEINKINLRWKWMAVEEKICEAFNWARRFMIDRRDEDRLWIRGIAVFPTCSLNDKCYSREEIKRMMRTAIEKPIRVNHGKPPYQNLIIGKVIDAEEEEGRGEFIGVITNKAWINRILKMKPEERKLSISGRPREEIRKDGETYPVGIVIDEISILVPPETPGIPETTFQTWTDGWA